MSKAEKLGRLLDEAGFGRTDVSDDLERLAWAAGVETRRALLQICRGRLASRRPLVERDLLTWFDAEGDYNQDGRHSSLLRYVLRATRLAGASFGDRWFPARGRLITVRTGSRTDGWLQPSDRERPSDYAETELVVHVASDALRESGSELRAYPLYTGDQTSCIALLPESRIDAIRHDRLLKLEPTEGADWLDDPPGRNQPRHLTERGLAELESST